MSDILSDLQTAVVTLLDAAADLSSLSILNAASNTVLGDYDTALAGSGCCAVVLAPRLDFTPTGACTATVTVRVVEKVMQNRSAAGTQVAGSAWAMHIAAWIADPAASLGETWTRPVLVQVDEDEPTEDTLTWVVQFTTETQITSETHT